MLSKLAKCLPFAPFDKLRTGFDGLRTNGVRSKSVEDLPFVLSLSKHTDIWRRTMPEF